MQTRDVQVVIAVILAGIVGFALATLLMDDDGEPAAVETAATTAQNPAPTATAPAGTTTTTTTDDDGTTETGQVPTTEAPTDGNCVALWNRDNNTSPQAFLADLQNRQAVRVNVGATAQAPPKCLVTLIANDGAVYRFTEGAATAFPYSPRPAQMQLAALGPRERETDALPESGGRLSPR